MRVAFLLAVEIALWWAAIVKLRHLRHAPTDPPLRAVTGVCLCLALGHLAVMPGLNGLISSVVPGAPKLLLNLFTVTATYCLMAFYGHRVGGLGEAGQLRRRLAGLLAVQVVMAGSWLCAPESVRVDPASLDNLDQVSSAVFTAVALGYMGYSVGQAFRWSVGYARAAHRVRLRSSLRIVSFALACLFTACLAKAGVALGVLLAWWRAQEAVPVALSILYTNLVPLGTALVVIGFCYPAVASLPAQVRRTRQRRALYLRLGPVWRRMRAAFPHLVLPGAVPRLPGGWLPWTYRAYYRRVIEIRDAIDQLAPYYDPEVVAQARSAEFGNDLGSAAGEQEIRICAVLIADALSRRGQDRPVASPFVLPALGGEDLDSDARWLARLADAIEALPGQFSSAPFSSRTSSIRST